jgi:hypothetical protein
VTALRHAVPPVTIPASLSRRLRSLARGACLLAIIPAPAGICLAANDEVVAIAAKVSRDYTRKKLPDGTFEAESYAFGKGDNLSGARVDGTADKLDFMDVARTMAVPLAEKRYLPTADPKTTRLLIMVYWGTTRAPEFATDSNSHYEAQLALQSQARAVQGMKDYVNPIKTNPTMSMNPANEAAAAADGVVLAATIGIQAENQRREDADMKIATLLGYDSWWIKANGAMDAGPMGISKADMRSELEEDRYFVVLSAFDYQALVKSKKMKFLWEVRFSIREHGNAFDDKLAAMTEKASEFFGRDSGGLRHESLPDGKVEIGAVKSLGVVSDDDPARPPPTPSPPPARK